MISLPHPEANPLERATWPSQQTWLWDHLIRFYNVMNPLIEIMPC